MDRENPRKRGNKLTKRADTPIRTCPTASPRKTCYIAVFVPFWILALTVALSGKRLVRVSGGYKPPGFYLPGANLGRDWAKMKRLLFSLLVLLIAAGSLLVVGGNRVLWPHGHWKSEPVHSTVEALGALLAIGMAMVLFQRERERRTTKFFVLATGFLGIGLLDGFHAACSPGRGSVLLHSIASLVGGFCFALVWLPESTQLASVRRWIPWVVAGLCTLFGAWVFFLPETLPRLVYHDGTYTATARIFNLVAGVLFTAAAVHFWLDFDRSRDLEALQFLPLILLFGMAGFTFPNSQPWCDAWWFRHVLLLLAYLLTFAFVARGYLRIASDLRLTLIKHGQAEETLRQRTHDLHERVKELNCLYHLSRLIEQSGNDLGGVFRGLLDVLASSWQHPDVTCAKLVFQDREYKTRNFKETQWRLAAPIKVYGEPAGRVEVCYLEEEPVAYEGPFLKEERTLIDTIAKRLGEIAERKILEREVSQVSTREQQRIGQELHDGLGQELTGLGYLAESLYCDLKNRNAAETEIADKVARGIEQALDQTRTIARGLIPVEVDVDGLVSALEQLAASTGDRCGTLCQFRCSQPEPVLDAATANQLFRIAQEAVNNAVKHGQADQITVEFSGNDREITLRVLDDGVGIRQDLEQTTGMGLRIMHYRARVIGATLDIRPAKTGGTLLTCTLFQDDYDDRKQLT